MSKILYTIHYEPWDKLHRDDIHDIMTLRQEVFVVEQNCVYQDVDGCDQECDHLWFRAKDLEVNPVIAYARIVPRGLKYPSEMSFGRVATKSTVRGTGIGKVLMAEILNLCNEPCRISAQAYLEKFYQRFGFKTVGLPYLEDNISHVEMLLEGKDESKI